MKLAPQTATVDEDAAGVLPDGKKEVVASLRGQGRVATADVAVATLGLQGSDDELRQAVEAQDDFITAID